MKTEDYTPILESAGIRPTSTRLLIYEAIARNSDTFSLSTLERQLDSIDKSVIFRTLVLFHEHHLIHSVDDGSGSLHLPQPRTLPRRRGPLPLLLRNLPEHLLPERRPDTAHRPARRLHCPKSQLHRKGYLRQVRCQALRLRLFC